MNKLIESWRTAQGGTIAVLETPCYPASWYAGHVIMRHSVFGEDWIPLSNDTYLFHRSEADALATAKKMVMELSSYVIRAAQFAAKAHGDQRRKYTGRPYIEHPGRVASAVMLYDGVTEVEIAAAWCHDVLEDTKVTEAELQSVIGPEATAIVVALTHPPLSAGNRATRQQLYLEQLQRSPYWVRMLKLLDRLDNLREMPPKGTATPDEEKFLKLYRQESIRLIERARRTMMTFMDFLERADAKMKRGFKLLGPKPAIPPFHETHVFHCGNDMEFTKVANDLRTDLLVDLKNRVPFPYDDCSFASIVTHDDGQQGWIMDRCIQLGEGDVEIGEWMDVDVVSAESRDKWKSAFETIRGTKRRAQQFACFRVEDDDSPVTIWMVAYHGVIGDADTFAYSCAGEDELAYGVERASESPLYEKIRELMYTNVSALIRQVALVSHPSNYYVKVEPKLTPREQRRMVQRGEPRPARKSPHFIVIDHEQLDELNRRHGGGGHAAPVPHHRRGHWRQVSDRFYNAKLRGERMWVRPTYVGETRFEDDKAIYNVLMDRGPRPRK